MFFVFIRGSVFYHMIQGEHDIREKEGMLGCPWKLVIS